MAYFLTISLTSLISNGHASGLHLVIDFLQEFIIGAAMGFAMGKISHWLINRIKLDADGLYPVLLLGLAMFTYAATHFIGGNGFLAIYLSAVVLGNSSFIHRRTLIRFYEGQAWLMQIILFLTLGLLVFPSRIVAVAGMGLLISAFLIFVARPVGVFTSLAFFRTNTRSKVFISWVGLRGGVPIVFATYPLLAGLERAPLLFDLVFFISVTSVLFQGTTLAFVAKLLGVAAATPKNKTQHSNALEQYRTASTELKITPGSPIIGQRIVNLKLPASISITYIKRGDTFIQPVGSTIIQEGDVLYILTDDQQALEKAHQLTLQV